VPRAARHAAGVLLVPLLLAVAAGPASAAGGISVTTPFPLVAVEPGASVTFPLTVTSTTTQVVTLALGRLPTGWSARFTGGGFTVDGVLAAPAAPGTASLDLSVPADATGSTRLTVEARGPAGGDVLELTVRVASEAGGNVSLEATYPSLRGPASATFPFDLTLRNDTPRETTFALSGQGPDGWTVDVRPSGSSQATSLKVAAGSSGGVSVSVTPAPQAAAGEYPVTVVADGGGTPTQAQLTVVVTGSYALLLTTPDQVLSTDATAGQGRQFQIVLRNDGSGALSNVTPGASPPTGWTVTFDPASIATIAPGSDQAVTATITPASDAVAGDYNIGMTATATEASASTTIRVTVNTSLSWAVVGGALIVLVLLGLGWVFAKYGRR
jgi:uncharacterized membrane protein